MANSTTRATLDIIARLAQELRLMRPLIPTYIHLLISAIFPIYTASHASLTRPTSAAPATRDPTRPHKDDGDDESDDEPETEEPPQLIETLTPSDALLFPVLAGATLASLYFILKWLQDPALLNYYLGLYFAFVGEFFCVKFFKDGMVVVRSFVFPTQYTYDGGLWTVVPREGKFVSVVDEKEKGSQTTKTTSSPLPGRLSVLFRQSGRITTLLWSIRGFSYTRLRLAIRIARILPDSSLKIDTLDVLGFLVGTPLVYWHTFVAKPWFLTNTLGFAFCYGSLQFTTPGTAWTGTLILTALFFYDVYFVFFTPLMVTVATKLDVPIKLLFPRPDGCVFPVGAVDGSTEMEAYLTCLAKKRTMAMLGLGDIVVPGMILAFALRFDLYMHYHRLRRQTTVSPPPQAPPSLPVYQPSTGLWGERFWTTHSSHSSSLRAKSFPRPYFHACSTGYVVGMCTTLVAMQISRHAQPALLYLVPGVLIGFWGRAWHRGEVGLLWRYSEVDQAETEKKDEAERGKEGEGEKTKVVPPTESGERKRKDKDRRARKLVYFALEVVGSSSRRDAHGVVQGQGSNGDHVKPDTERRGDGVETSR